jgi:hypothetical protein
MKDFDFDEWADLYRRDPQAFEARREAMLAIELARGGASAGHARAALAKLDQQLVGCSDQERAEKSFVWMAASIRQLSQRMGDLGERIAALNTAIARAQGATPPARAAR